MPVTPWPTILPTVGDIWTQALDYADMTNSQFPDSSLELKHVNNALSKLHYHLANSQNDWFADQAYMPITAGVEYFPLPDGTTYTHTSSDATIPRKFYRMTKLFLNVSNREYEIPRLFRHEEYGYTRAPLVSGHADMLYVPEFKALTATSAAIDTTYPAGWEDYCAWIIARRLLMKEESFEAATAAAAEASELLKDINEAVCCRDSSYPQRIEDSSGRWDQGRRWKLARNYENNYSYIIEGQSLIIVNPQILP